MVTHGRHARVAALQPGDELLGWVWAVQSQERLWQDHDHAWHERAQNGWSDSDLYGMLSTYGLLRGKKGAILAGDGPSQARHEFGVRAVSYAKSLQDRSPAENTKTWQSFGTAFRDCCVENGWWPVADTSADWFMPSATLKAMWFTAPTKIPMFDGYAVQGLRQITGRTISPNLFLEEVASLLEKYSGMVTAAKAIWESPYSHDIRIVDKYLWLRGSGRMQPTLDRFHAACNSW